MTDTAPSKLWKRIFSIAKPVVSLSAVIAFINYLLIPVNSIDEWLKSPLSQEELVERALTYDPNIANSAKEEVSRLQQDIQKITTVSQTLETQKVILLGQIDELKSQQVVLREENQRLIRSLGSLETKVDLLKQQNDSFANQLSNERQQHERTKMWLSSTKIELASATAVQKDELGFVLNKKGGRICRTVEVSPPIATPGSTDCGNTGCISSFGEKSPGVYREECFMGYGIWASPQLVTSF